MYSLKFFLLKILAETVVSEILAAIFDKTGSNAKRPFDRT